MTDDTTLLQFPCDFPIKIIGLTTINFVLDISALVLKYFPNTPATHIVDKQSLKGNYTSITATVHVLDKVTLDELYKELTKYPGIKMVL